MIAIIPTRPQTTREILKTGFLIWRKTFWRILPFALMSGTLLMAQPWEVIKEGGAFIRFIPLLNSVLMLILNAGMVYRIHSIIQKKDLGFKHALYIGFRKTPFLFIVSFLFLLGVVGGLMLLIIPGLMLFIFLIFSTYLVIIADIKVLDSLKESYRLVSGHVWYVSCVVSLLILFCLMGAVLLTIVVMAIIQLSAAFNFGVPTEAVAFFLVVLIYSWYTTYIYSNMLVLLYDLQIKSRLQECYSVKV